MLAQPFIIPATIFLLLSIPLILGIVPPNPIYGVRTPMTMNDPQLWYGVNRYGGWAILLSSIVYLCVAGILPTPPDNSDFARWLVHLVAFVLPLILSLLFVRAYLSQTQEQ